MARTPIVDRLARRFGSDLDRRSFLTRTAMTGTALAVAPTDFVLRPGDAYSQVCPAPGNCPGGARCRGYTEMCCTIYGSNRCPAGTTMAGWWRADGSGFCGAGQPRYYMDCNANCGGCGCGGNGICSGSCTGTPCHCAGCNCNNWKQGCSHFRYGNCNNHIRCVGPIVCRVVSCTAPWHIDPGCVSSAPRWDNNTRYHDRPCLHAPPRTTDGDLWFTTSNGAVHAYGDAAHRGDASAIPLARPIVGMARTPSRNGYWLVASDGGIFSFGDARFYGSTGAIRLNQPIVGMASTPTGRGYWLVASDGGVFCFGDAKFYGSTGAIRLNQPVVGMAPTGNGRGYWLVARDGGIFCFGNAKFYGSAANLAVGAPFVGMAPHHSTGYWLAAANGVVAHFGSAPRLALDPPSGLTSSMVAIAPTTTGNGYYLVGGDGAVYPQGDGGQVTGEPQPVSRSVVGAASFR